MTILGNNHTPFMPSDSSKMVNAGWHQPPPHMTLASQEIHVWKVPLRPPEIWLKKLKNLLNGEERERAERYKAPARQEAFVTTRGMLRYILGWYLDTKPEHLKFDMGSHGKPYLVEPPTSPGISFNLAHSADLALLAITHDRQVGIDIEHHRQILDYAGMVKRICSPAEQSFLMKIPHESQLTAFLSCWTRKEAYTKAIGKGITFPLNTITVSLTRELPVKLLHVEGHADEPSRWTMCELFPGAGYSAALVGEGQSWTPICWEWSWNTPL